MFTFINSLMSRLAGASLIVLALAMPIHAQVAENPLTSEDFWKEATLETVTATVTGGASVQDMTPDGYDALIRAAASGADAAVISYPSAKAVVALKAVAVANAANLMDRAIGSSQELAI